MRRNRSALVRLLAAVLACSGGIAIAQLRDWGNRVEGTNFRLNGLRDYELLGFFAFREEFSMRDDLGLRLRFFAPDPNEKAFVEARELTGAKGYVMRPKDDSVKNLRNGWREFTGWPVRDVLRPMRIAADDLGVIIRLKTNAEFEENIAPAFLTDERQEIAGVIGDYVLYLKFGQTLKNLTYEVEGTSHYSDPHTYVSPANPKDSSVGGGIATPLSFSAKSIPAGPVTIHIGRKYANSTAEAAEITYRFYHEPL